jgi:hypothetical protein
MALNFFMTRKKPFFAATYIPSDLVWPTPAG